MANRTKRDHPIFLRVKVIGAFVAGLLIVCLVWLSVSDSYELERQSSPITPAGSQAGVPAESTNGEKSNRRHAKGVSTQITDSGEAAPFAANRPINAIILEVPRCPYGDTANGLKEALLIGKANASSVFILDAGDIGTHFISLDKQIESTEQLTLVLQYYVEGVGRREHNVDYNGRRNSTGEYVVSVSYPSVWINYEIREIPQGESEATVCYVTVGRLRYFVGKQRNGTVVSPPTTNIELLRVDAKHPKQPFYSVEVQNTRIVGESGVQPHEVKLDSGQIYKISCDVLSIDNSLHLGISGENLSSMLADIAIAEIEGTTWEEFEEKTGPCLPLKWLHKGKGFEARNSIVTTRGVAPGVLNSVLDRDGRIMTTNFTSAGQLNSLDSIEHWNTGRYLIIHKDGRALIVPPIGVVGRPGDTLDFDWDKPTQPIEVQVHFPTHLNPDSHMFAFEVIVPGPAQRPLQAPKNDFPADQGSRWLDVRRIDSNGIAYLTGIPSGASWWPIGVVSKVTMNEDDQRSRVTFARGVLLSDASYFALKGLLRGETDSSKEPFLLERNSQGFSKTIPKIGISTYGNWRIDLYFDDKN